MLEFAINQVDHCLDVVSIAIVTTKVPVVLADDNTCCIVDEGNDGSTDASIRG